ncbi:MATE family efflux transporter [uncultured Sphaerochaeta sp.]|uniref:MATE family efflux transporter n=1 Tax=uncultured Sphaerochaeta sp. TaxID=886478 RepID=UPI002A0A2B84|nr:MATE family efflux transporter [uncultured Sphaerochaeta sp.]
MRIQLSDHFTYKKLLRFTFPSIGMMVFISIYGVIDGFFVSNFVGKTAFSAINLIMPFFMIFGSFGFMIGTGGSALVARILGLGDKKTANGYFSMMIIFTLLVSLILSIAGYFIIRPLATMLGATGNMIEDCVRYGKVLIFSLPSFMLQNVFQSFLVTAEKPKLGLIYTIVAGVANIVLDGLFIIGFHWGVFGAALATVISQSIGGLLPFIYFIRPNKSLLRLQKTRLELQPLVKACTNGASEMMSNISSSLVSVLYNFQLLRLVGENGVAAYGVLMYVNFIFLAVFIGYSIGSSPIVSYHFGAENHAELHNMKNKSLILMALAGIGLTLLAQILATPLAKLFVGYDHDLFIMTRQAFKLFSISFLATGLNIFASGFFTALNNGAVSAAISFIRTLVFQLLSVLLLPVFLGINGIWLAIVVAEMLTLIVSFFFLATKKKRYHY